MVIPLTRQQINFEMTNAVHKIKDKHKLLSNALFMKALKTETFLYVGPHEKQGDLMTGISKKYLH